MSAKLTHNFNPHLGSVRGSMFDVSLDQATKSPLPEDGADPEGHHTPVSQEHECMYTNTSAIYIYMYIYCN